MTAFKCTKSVPWPDRRENVMFNKRRRSLFKKANELSVKTSTELYIVMHRKGRYFTYNSTDRQGWPPNENELVRPLPQVACQSLSIELQEENYPLTERQDPSNLHTVRSSRRNKRRQPELQKTCQEGLRQEDSLEQYQESSFETARGAYVSPSSSPKIDICFSPDLETTALLRAIEDGEIGPNTWERKQSTDEATGVTNKLERPGWAADVENNLQLFEHHGTNTSRGPEDIDSVVEDPNGLARLEVYTNRKGKNCSGTSLAPRRKFVIPKLPDFSKLLERCT